ncbi:MAG: (d)CMP kinase [Alphaproteobacteria bacterium]|nr:(d)CMP kinase [Alphaproteobacteria bacterium]
MIITIDGPAAAGKGTLASTLSEKYHLAYFDTGMIYRAVGLEIRLSGVDVNDEQQALQIAQTMTFPRMMELAKDKRLRDSIGGEYASIVAAMTSVRAKLLKMQQDFALRPVYADGTPAKGAIYDGRDTGTVVCPHADIKFYITASPEVRAERRYKEFIAKGVDISYEQVLQDVKIRDERDSNRSSAPLKPAEDAIILDTSNLGIAEVLKKACEIIDSYQKNS